jgi:DNA-binding CsgD family transcriptional regulator
MVPVTKGVVAVLRTQAKEKILIVIFAIVIAASGADLVADLSHGATAEHVAKEAVIVIMSIFAITWMLLGLHRQKLEISALQNELEGLEKPQASPKKYVLDARKKLGNVVTQQFSEWKLTDSEADVGWLMLKGLSLKEIAMVRSTLEKTVRQQASSIYKKSGVQGRHAFSAWFIEDIL